MEKLKDKNPSDLVYIDESGIDDNEVYEYAWGRKGQRIYGMKHGHKKKRLSIICALNIKNIKAPFIFDGMCDRKVFEAYVEKVLVPELRVGQTVIMDNASFHKSNKIKEMIEKAGCELLYLPPYSPDLNLIEPHWFGIKHHIKKWLSYFERDLFQTAEYVFQKILCYR